jgi:hypothetical protein
MSSEVKANKLSPATGTAFTFGDSGDTFTVPSGATIANSGTATGFGAGADDFVSVYKSGDQALTKNVIAKVAMNAQYSDANGWWDETTNYRFQPDVSGNYLFLGELGFGNGTSSGDNVDIYFYKNGAEIFANETSQQSGYVQAMSASAIIIMNGSSDYVEMFARSGANGTLTLDAQGFNMATTTNIRLNIVRLAS